MKHRPIPKSLREQVYRKYDGHCAYCGCTLEYKDMQVDHAESVYVSSMQNGWADTQNDSLENLMPACRQCNYYKDINDIEHFRKSIKETLEHTCIKPFQAQLAVKYGIITFHPWDGKFYFEKQEKK